MSTLDRHYRVDVRTEGYTQSTYPRTKRHALRLMRQATKATTTTLTVEVLSPQRDGARATVARMRQNGAA